MEQPFYWQERVGWYLNQRSATGKRTRHRLGDTQKAAFKKWRAMLARQKVVDRGLDKELISFEERIACNQSPIKNRLSIKIHLNREPIPLGSRVA